MLEEGLPAEYVDALATRSDGVLYTKYRVRSSSDCTALQLISSTIDLCSRTSPHRHASRPPNRLSQAQSSQFLAIVSDNAYT